MARPRQQTTIQLPPRLKSFNPSGYYSGEAGQIILNVEEYECIRLLDYEGLAQTEAAVYMSVSRPTLTRIYERARNKMAAALVEAKQLLIEGGSVQYNGCWGHCLKCQSRFCPGKPIISDACPLCGSTEMESASLGAHSGAVSVRAVRAVIPVESDGSDPKLFGRFARSPFFAIVDVVEEKTEIVPNVLIEHAQGIGAAVTEYLAVMRRANLFVAYELGLKVQALAHKRGLGQVILHSELHTLGSLQKMLYKK